MASGDNVDVIEVVETSYRGPDRGGDSSSRLDDSGDEDGKLQVIEISRRNLQHT